MGDGYRDLFEHATCGMVVLDLEGHFRAVNPAAAEMLGRPVPELVGTTLMDFLPSHQVTAFLEKLALLPSLNRFQVELPLRQAQAGAVSLEAGLVQWKEKPAALVFLREATVTEEAERSLQIALRTLLLLAGHLKAAFFLLRPDGRIERVPEPGPGMALSPESPSWAWRVLHRAEVRELLPRVWAGERVTLKPTWYVPGECATGETDKKNADESGEAQLMRLDFLPLQLPDEPICRVLVVVRDCTDEHLEKERGASGEREASLALFAGALFQELNAYLGVILAQASALRLSAAPGRLAPPAVGSILDAAQEAAAVLRRCSEAGSEEGLEEVDLNVCVVEVMRTLGRELKDVEIETDLDGKPPLIRGTSHLLQTMLLAFVRQAATHMPGGGRIRVETRILSGATPVAPKGVEVTISDTGLGVSRDYSTEPGGSLFPGGGSGSVEPLALTFARAIVQRHRGQCEVSNVPGKGTTWRISFPGYEQVPSLSGPLPSLQKLSEGERVERPHMKGFSAEETGAFLRDVKAKDPSGSGTTAAPRLRVLLADDEDNILQAGRETLSQSGYEPVIAADGQEAFERFQRDPSGFALVVLDAYMPRLGGLEAYLRMQAVRPDLPVLFVSGFVRGASRKALLNACPGRAQVLLKPFTDTDLLAAVEGLISARSD